MTSDCRFEQAKATLSLASNIVQQIYDKRLTEEHWRLIKDIYQTCTDTIFFYRDVCLLSSYNEHIFNNLVERKIMRKSSRPYYINGKSFHYYQLATPIIQQITTAAT